jgi:MinD-like ATPase involved in chromosome partitioning or flagellar assembly
VTPLHDSLELASLGHGGAVGPDRRALLRRVPTIFERRSVVVVDAGSRLEGLERCLDLKVGSILVISGSDAMSLASTHALIKATREMSELDLAVVFNRVHRDEARAGAAVLEEGARRFLGHVPRIVGPVGLDSGLQERLATGATLLQSLVESSLPDQIADLMPELRPWTPT